MTNTALKTAQPPAPIETPSGKNSGTENFPVGSFLIRPDLRPHVHAFYRFARNADDISDNPQLEAQEKISRLDRVAAVLTGASDEDIQSALAMRKSLQATNLPPDHCLDLLTAFKRDATQLRYTNWADLMDYCRYSAAPVGRQVLALHGIGKEAWAANDALCSALQIINHLQDCGDDYREMDRVYLPADILTRHSASLDDLSQDKLTEPLRATLDDLLDKTDELMPLARSLPRFVPDWRLKMETAVIASLADKLLALLREKDPLHDDVKLSKPAKIVALFGGLLRCWSA